MISVFLSQWHQYLRWCLVVLVGHLPLLVGLAAHSSKTRNVTEIKHLYDPPNFQWFLNYYLGSTFLNENILGPTGNEGMI